MSAPLCRHHQSADLENVGLARFTEHGKPLWERIQHGKHAECPGPYAPTCLVFRVDQPCQKRIVIKPRLNIDAKEIGNGS